MTPRSSTLFHFTKNRETLQSILANGFWPRYCAEDTRWVGQENAPIVAFPMVCFCDIPLSRISDHVDFYDQYGIGVTREWGIKNSLNPVLYVAGENPVCSELRSLNAHANKLDGEDKSNAKESVRYLYAHVKPSRGIVIINGSPVEKDFYLESEWRHVPQNTEISPYLRSDIFSDSEKLAVENDKTNLHCKLKLSPGDIKYIFVKNDSDIPNFIDFIQSGIAGILHSEAKMLMSRVTSLESIQADL